MTHDPDAPMSDPTVSAPMSDPTVSTAGSASPFKASSPSPSNAPSTSSSKARPQRRAKAQDETTLPHASNETRPPHTAKDPSLQHTAKETTPPHASKESADESWDAVAKWLDALSEPDARVALSRCCDARRWIDAMLNARPYRAGARLDRMIDRAFSALEKDDWLEAFAAHPRIGEKKERLQAFAHAEDSEREQSGVHCAHAATLAALADGNRRYEAKFDHVFLVCATGKTADQMLAILRSRLANTPEAELRVAGAELAKIARLRLAELR